MSIKSDNWIRRMAAKGMIEPFEAGQVRTVDGRRIVSYGTSSYGYDVRCANEFKIFTNINSTIVDPKAFDPQSFIDVTSDVAIIPPNSFALARTVEYFRIPRSVLTVCLGKCVTGDTRVVDAATGEYLPITEMRFGRQTLALDGGQLKPARVSAFMRQGVKRVFELRTRAGLRIRATANHPFRSVEGWTPLEALQAGDRIAVAREIPVFGNCPLPDAQADLLGLMISAASCQTPGGGPAGIRHDPRLVQTLEAAVTAAGLELAAIGGAAGQQPVHHADRAGMPGPDRALQWLRTQAFMPGTADPCVPPAVFKAPRASVRRFLQALLTAGGDLHRSAETVGLGYASRSRRLVEDVHHLLLRFGIFARIDDPSTASDGCACRVLIAGHDQLARFAQRIGFVPGSEKERQLESEILSGWREDGPCGDGDSWPDPAWLRDSAVAAAGGGGAHASSAASAERPSRARPAPRRGSAGAGATDLVDLGAGPTWDVVASIEPAGEEEVYDISVPGVHNFVANGMVVHNSTYARCGIIVNVTPLEPEWEGHVTLEFSNTTTLPAKIYANEGVAQMLFFESDEVCATSYKDRGGKYMGQRGVTLPKT